MRISNHYCTVLRCAVLHCMHCTVLYDMRVGRHISAHSQPLRYRGGSLFAAALTLAKKAPDIHMRSDLADFKADVSAVTKT